MGLCEHDPSCDKTYNVVMPLSCASTRGRYSRIVGVTQVAHELHMKSSSRNNFGNRVYRRVRFWSCGTVGYGPTMWFKSRENDDILHGYDSKACQRLAGQLCWKDRWYPGRGMKRTIFLLVETRRANRQSSRPSVVIEMSSTIVIGSYWHSGTPWCLHKQGNITAYII